jgi:hypothetical protein
MTDTLGAGQVDGGDLVCGEEDSVFSVDVKGTDGETFAAEGLRDFPQAAFEADIGFGGGDGADQCVGLVFDFRQAFRPRPRAWAIAVDWDILVESFVRAFEIVEGAPLIEGALDGRQVFEAREGEDFGFERAVEALIFASALRVIRAAVDQPDPELEEPDAQPRPRLGEREAPRPAVVDEHRLGQAIEPERGFQMLTVPPCSLAQAARHSA